MEGRGGREKEENVRENGGKGDREKGAENGGKHDRKWGEEGVKMEGNVTEKRNKMG